MVTEQQLANKIEAAIRDIPASNSAYISIRQEVLSDLLSQVLIYRIAKVAATIAIESLSNIKDI